MDSRRGRDPEHRYYAVLFYGMPQLREVAVGMADGLTLRQMALMFGVSPSTIQDRKRQVIRRIKACNDDPERDLVRLVIDDV